MTAFSDRIAAKIAEFEFRRRAVVYLDDEEIARGDDFELGYGGVLRISDVSINEYGEESIVPFSNRLFAPGSWSTVSYEE